ncbi:LytR C-terminal domain-containing protein [Bifidobacterium bifidum]|mgnify:FL=1|uniref:LytR C-terminal domain-containing protein n=1 Tax=Bifidobacterium bifidum TaxID=1681 RepID=UPI0022DF7F35|nr:LytR C-terminal domain-containing protein [Bifidobacterium bifidum]
MAKDKETYDSYAKDVFDNPPAGPVGVHRGARSAGARMTPFLIVLLVVALVGVGTWGVLSGMFSDVLFGNNGTSQAADDKASDSGDSKTGGTTKSGTDEQSTSSSTDSSSSDTASNTSTDSAQSDTTSSSSDGSTDATDTNGQGTDSTASSDTQSTPPATAEANKATSVRVINGTKISGHAASRAYTLKQAGYTNVVSANPSGTLPASTVVWYQNETDAATAKDIAVTLGISDVRQMSGISAPVVVVLMQ